MDVEGGGVRETSYRRPRPWIHNFPKTTNPPNCQQDLWISQRFQPLSFETSHKSALIPVLATRIPRTRSLTLIPLGKHRDRGEEDKQIIRLSRRNRLRIQPRQKPDCVKENSTEFEKPLSPREGEITPAGFGAGGGIRTHEPLRDRRLRPALPRPLIERVSLTWLGNSRIPSPFPH